MPHALMAQKENKPRMGKRIHFVGIGGAGMSAIARVLLSEGKRVSGSDVEGSAVIDELRQLGAEVHIGHRANQVLGADEVVLSTAIDPENPEAVEARRLGIPVRHRSEALADLMNAKTGVAVAGAHGKTTITSMIAWTLHQIGEPLTFLIGGLLPGIGGAKAGLGPILVAEADESDRSFLRYRPAIAVVTSIEPDHLEYYENSFAALREGYEQFLRQVKPDGVRVLCVDDKTVKEIADSFVPSETLVTYGLQSGAKYRAVGIETKGFHSEFRLEVAGVEVGRYRLSVPGRHNVQNALACIAVADALGMDREGIRRELETFRGARRRFEVVAQTDENLIIDDYAHHPTEIQATLRAVRGGFPGRRVIAVFQPHRYSRTSQLMEEFASSLGAADLVVLTDIYAPPPEKPISGVTGERLAALARAELGERLTYAPGLEEAAQRVRELLCPGDVVVTMGAGNVWKVARLLAGLTPERL